MKHPVYILFLLLVLSACGTSPEGTATQTAAVGSSTAPAEQPTPIEKIAPTPPATAIKEAESPTPEVEVVPAEKIFSLEDILLTQDELPEGAIDFKKVPKDDQSKLKITGPGQVFYQCALPSIIKKFQKDNKILGGMRLDLAQEDYNYCVPSFATKQSIGDAISMTFPALSSTEQQVLLERDLALSKAFIDAVLAFKTVPFLDGYYNIVLNEHNGTIEYLVYGNPNPPTGEWPFLGVLELPTSNP